jgi:hypothetical protein
VTLDNVAVKGFTRNNHHTAAKVQLKKQITLNAVQDPRQRDHSLGGNSSGADDNRSN